MLRRNLLLSLVKRAHSNVVPGIRPAVTVTVTMMRSATLTDRKHPSLFNILRFYILFYVEIIFFFLIETRSSESAANC